MTRLRRKALLQWQKSKDGKRYAAILAGALLATSTGLHPAYAAGYAATEQRSDKRVHIDIPAEPLDRALADFSQQSGIAVRYVPAAVTGRTSSAIKGEFTPVEALQKLLGNAPLTARVTDAKTITLEEQGGLQTIGRVSTSSSAYVTTSAGLGKYTQSLLDTPQTIVVVPSQVMQDQNSTTLRDALRNVSGISLAAGEGGSQGDSLTIRGFDAKDDFFLDGMRDFGNYYRDPFNLSAVEVIMGPASMLLGHGQGGGIVNQISKTAKLSSFDQISLTAGTDNLQRFTFDANQRMGATAAFRINGMATTSNTADRSVTTATRFGLAPTLALGIGTRDRLTFSFYGQTDNAIPDYGLPYINDRPAVVPRSNFYGFANGDKLIDNILIGTISYDHDFSPQLTLHNQTRYAAYERSFGASDALTPSPQPLPGTPASAITVASTQHSRNGEETFLQNQTYLTGHFGAHTLLFGFEASRETSHEIQNTLTGLPSNNLQNPVPFQPFTFTSITPRSDNHVTADAAAVYAADSIRLSRYFEFDLGLRADIFDAQNNEFVSGTSAVQNVGKLSPQAAIVYKPVPNGSVYFAYDTSFQPSADALGLTNAQLVAPSTNTTFETGTKWSLRGGRLLVTGAVFNSVMNNVHITEPDGSVLPVGTEQSNGFQMQVQGNITPRWRVTAGYTLLETKILSYVLPTQPGIVGSRIPNAPTGSATFWSTYNVGRMQFGLGVFGLSQRQASIGVDTLTGQPILVPGYVRTDLQYKYRLSTVTSVQVNVNNLLDKYYFDELHPDHVVPGAGRSIWVNLMTTAGR